MNVYFTQLTRKLNANQQKKMFMYNGFITSTRYCTLLQRRCKQSDSAFVTKNCIVMLRLMNARNSWKDCDKFESCLKIPRGQLASNNRIQLAHSFGLLASVRLHNLIDHFNDFNCYISMGWSFQGNDCGFPFGVRITQSEENWRKFVLM